MNEAWYVNIHLSKGNTVMEGLVESAHLAVFLFGVFFISFSGAMMPGPVTAAAIVKGQESSRSGILVALGHGIVEFPLIILIALGLSKLFQMAAWKMAVGILGGGFLVWMGMAMIRERSALGEGAKNVPFGSLQAGVITTASNPYFFIWWATIGAALITRSLAWGVIGVALLMIVHWSVDLGWDWLLSFMSNKGKRVMTPKVQTAVFAVCGIVLVAFGIYFFIDGSGLLRLLGEKLA